MVYATMALFGKCLRMTGGMESRPAEVLLGSYDRIFSTMVVLQKKLTAGGVIMGLVAGLSSSKLVYEVEDSL